MTIRASQHRIHMVLTIPTLLVLFVSALEAQQVHNFWIKVSNFTCTPICIQVDQRGIFFVGDAYNGVFRSTDGGHNWVQVCNGLLDLRVVTIAVGPTGDIFAGTWGGGNSNPVRGIFRSTNEGEAWVKLGSDVIKSAVWAITFNSKGHIFVGTYEQGVFRSTDGGASWLQKNVGLPKLYVWSLATDSRDRVYAGMFDGFVAHSTDNGDNWVPAESGLTWPSFQCLAVGPRDRVYAGGDGGGLFYSDDFGRSWQYVSLGSFPGPYYAVGSIVINRLGYIYISATNGPFRSRDGGTTWQQMNSGLGQYVGRLALDSAGFLYTQTPEGFFRTTDLTTDIPASPTQEPRHFELYQNYPNPFNASTSISFSISKPSRVALRVFDLLGVEVAVLLSNDLATGNYTLQWNSPQFPSGSYYYRLESADLMQTRKLILLK